MINERQVFAHKIIESAVNKMIVSSFSTRLQDLGARPLVCWDFTLWIHPTATHNQILFCVHHLQLLIFKADHLITPLVAMFDSHESAWTRRDNDTSSNNGGSCVLKNVILFNRFDSKGGIFKIYGATRKPLNWRNTWRHRCITISLHH